MNNVYPVTSTRRRKGAARGRESNVLHSPYETCTWFFKTMTSKVAILLYVAIFSVLGQSALAQSATCASTVSITSLSGASVCTDAGTQSGTVQLRIQTTPTDAIEGSNVIIYRNGVIIATVPSTTNVAGTTSVTYTDNTPGAGNAAYTVTVNKSNCSDVQTATPTNVMVYGTPVVTAIGGTQTICTGSTGTFNVTVTGPISGTISLTVRNDGTMTNLPVIVVNASSTGTTVIPVTVNPTTPTNYTVVGVASSNGCTGVPGSFTTTVNVASQLPTLTVGSNLGGSNRACAGQEFMLEITNISAVAGPYTITWYKDGQPIASGSGSGAIFTGQGTASLTVTNPQVGESGSYSVKVCSSNPQYAECASGCGTSVPINVVVNAQPTATFSPVSSNVCVNSNTQIAVNFTGVGPFDLIYNVSVGGGAYSEVNVSNTNNPYTITVPTDMAGATYSYTLTSVQDQNCNNITNVTSTAFVQVSNFDFTLTPTIATVCYGGNTNVVASSNSGTNTVTYTLSGGTPVNRTVVGGIASTTFTGLAAGTYTVTATSAGCTVTRTVTIAQYPQVFVSAATTAPITCNGGSTSVTVTVSGGGSGNQYDISLGGISYGAPVGVGTYTFTNSYTAGTYAAVATNTTTGCAVTTSINVLQPTAIAVTATPGVSAISCFGGTTQIAVSATGGTGGTYTFTLDNGTTQTRISNVSSGTFTNVAGGTYTVSATDAAGCGSGTPATVNIAPATEIMGNAQAGAAQCNGGSGTITVNYTGGGASGNHIFSVQGPSTMASTSTNTSSYTFTGVLPGTYTATITDANGCSKVVGVITVTAPAAISASVTAGTIACPGGTTTITIGSTSGGRGDGNFIWTLTSATGGTTTISATSSGNYFYPVSAGTYTVSVNEAGCPAQFIQSLTIDEPAAIVASFTKTDITCTASTSTVTVSATGGGSATKTYQLVNANTSAIFGTQTNATGSATFSGVPVGTYNWVVTSGGCTVSSDPGTPSTQIVIAPYTAVTVGTVTATAVECFGSSTGSIQVSATGGSGSLTYAIQSGTYSNSNQTGSFTGLAGGTYTVTVTDALGCSAATRTATVGAGTASGTGAPDLVLAASTNPSTFPTVGSSVTITYGISNTSGNAASGVVLRVSKPTPGYSIELASGVTGWTKTLDNDNVVEFTKATDILCGTFTPIQLPVVVTRTSETAKGTFAVTGTVRSSVPDAYDPDNVRVLTYSAQ